MITYPKGQERVVQVILDSPSKNTCFKCLQQFRTKLQLRVHMNVAHNIVKRKGDDSTIMKTATFEYKECYPNTDENCSISQPEVYSLR